VETICQGVINIQRYVQNWMIEERKKEDKRRNIIGRLLIFEFRYRRGHKESSNK
jgi:hypothetical protein